jgi:hypothetical protein
MKAVLENLKMVQIPLLLIVRRYCHAERSEASFHFQTKPLWREKMLRSA